MMKKIIAVSVFILFFTSVLFISIAGAKNVSQYLGFKDVKFSNLNRDFCADCHGKSLVDTHHATAKAKAGECVFCHSVSKGDGESTVVLVRDCLQCHKESPHHKTQAALDNECTSCHDTPGLSDYSTDVASYDISSVTPAVSNCLRCHGSGTNDGIQVFDFKETHHGITLGNCDVCHLDTDPKTTNIRVCQRCHSVAAIHKVGAHVVPENCVECHVNE